MNVYLLFVAPASNRSTHTEYNINSEVSSQQVINIYRMIYCRSAFASTFWWSPCCWSSLFSSVYPVSLVEETGVLRENRCFFCFFFFVICFWIFGLLSSRFLCPVLPVFLDCLFLIASLVVSNVYLFTLRAPVDWVYNAFNKWKRTW